jgi:hypothetical protein
MKPSLSSIAFGLEKVLRAPSSCWRLRTSSSSRLVASSFGSGRALSSVPVNPRRDSLNLKSASRTERVIREANVLIFDQVFLNGEVRQRILIRNYVGVIDKVLAMNGVYSWKFLLTSKFLLTGPGHYSIKLFSLILLRIMEVITRQ